MPNEDLVGFLMGEPPVVEAVTVTPEVPVPAPAAEIITSAPPISMPQPDEEMRNLMSWMKRIGMCAKDMHYRCKGKPFYGLHELADLVYETEHITDQIAEIYFMGERGIEPPRMEDVCRTAASLPINYPTDDRYFIGGTMDACLQAMHKIEDIKRNFTNLKSGTIAVLDAISQQCLLSIGLLDQTMKG